MANEDTRKADKITEMLAKLPKTMETSIARGFELVLSHLKGESVKINTETKGFFKDSKNDRDKETAVKNRDRASEMRKAMEAGLKINNGFSKGMEGMKQKLYMHLSKAELRTKTFLEKMGELGQKIKDYFKNAKQEFVKMGWGTFTGIVKTFTGPFYGLISKTSGVIGGSLVKLGSNMINKMGYKSLDKLLGKFEGIKSFLNPKEKEMTMEEKLLAFAEEFRTLLSNILDAQIDNTTKIVASLRELPGKLCSRLGTVNMVESPISAPAGAAGAGAGAGMLGGFFGKGGSQGPDPVTIEYYEFFKEKVTNIDEYLEQIWEKFKGESPGGGGGGGLVDNLMGKGGLMGKLKQFAFGKWGAGAAIGAGVLAGGYSGYKAYGEGREKGMSKGEAGANAVARGMITGSFTAIGTMFGGAAGGAAMGYLGDKVGAISNKIGEKLGTGLFDAKELVGKKFGEFGDKISSMSTAVGDKFSEMGTAVGTKFSDMKDSVMGTFSRVGEGFKDSKDYLKEKLDSFLPSGQDIMGVLKGILGGLMAAGTAVTAFVVNTATKAKETLANAGKTAGDLASKGAAAVSGALKLGGNKWKAETKGMNPEVMKALQAAAVDYKKQTGKTLTMTEGVRTKEQQAQLRGNNKYPTAKPGMSMHQFGYAADVNAEQANEMARLGILKKHGLTQPVAGDPVHLELAKLANAEKRSEIRRTVAQVDNTPKVKAAATGGLVNIPGRVDVHAAEIISPIGKFQDMLSKTAATAAQPAMMASSALDGKAVEYLSAISSGITQLISTKSKEPAPQFNNSSIPDFPGDPGIIFGGNYFPQKGKQWG